ncbi:hypothetical protein K8I85_00070 [bacterium]|nr:hypothetical protein [bacterium]
MIASRIVPLLAALLTPTIGLVTPAAAADAPADERIGVPDGVTLDAFAHPANGEVYVFVRFAEPRPGDVTVTIRDAAGADAAVRTATLEHGSAMILWDRALGDGGTAAAGEYAAHLTVDGREVVAGFTLR